jgi:laccase
VENGKTYLLRIVNAALRSEYYFKIAGHTFTVVAADANYVKPYTTDIIAIAPGETIDALLIADAPPGKYYMFALGIQSAEPNKQYPVMISRGIVYYNNSSKGYEVDTPAMAPEMPIYNDRSASLYFHGNLSSLPHRLLPSVPSSVNERMFITMDSGHICKEGWPSCNATVTRMNNISFQMPATTPLLLAHYNKNISSAISMVREFPSTSPKIEFNEGMTMKATSFTRVPYNTTVEIVFQGPPEGISYPNPMHLHGHEFFVLAQGLGQYEAEKDLHTYNLVDPPLKNTANVQRVGWTVIRFVANNPGM